MKLFYYQPDGHGPASFFVLAASAEEAAIAVNEKRRQEMSRSLAGGYYWGDADFKADDFTAADAGEVIVNDND